MDEQSDTPDALAMKILITTILCFNPAGGDFCGQRL